MPRKAKKQAEPADTTAAAPKPEENEPGLTPTSEAGLDRELEQEAEARMRAVSPVAASGQIEQLAEAADTFEQAYDDAVAPERLKPVPDEIDSPEPSLELVVEHDQEESEGGPRQTSEEDTEKPSPGRLERLQKILSQAGIASRRHAEEMITEGRVQVNGKVVTELGSKADPERDHIRVDGKLIHGTERLRYFILNKPRGYVTTVSDPEGRPTVMQFFKKMSERLYPVGRLDYQSEGLLLVTNDGDLANKLTKAATGVEKTYLVKVSGQPSEDELDRLREGVGIDRGRPGEGRVHTSPATIREARAGDNPWYEVILTEGRNRELRKMFDEIGHHVEKIRRVGYGPLVLDVEPGQFRELEPEELAKLRLAAEGKWRRAKPKGPQQFKQKPRREGGAPDLREKPRGERGAAAFRDNRRPGGPFQDRSRRPASGEGEQRKDWRKPRFERPAESRDEASRPSQGGARATGRGFARRDEGPRSFQGGRPRGSKPDGGAREWKREGPPPRGDRRPYAGGAGGGRQQRPDARPRFERPRAESAEGERGRARGSFIRPARTGTGQGQERSRGSQSRPEQPQFGRDGGGGRGNERGGGGRPPRESGAQRSSRPPGRPAQRPSGRPPGGTKSAGRGPSGRGTSSRGPSSRGPSGRGPGRGPSGRGPSRPPRTDRGKGR